MFIFPTAMSSIQWKTDKNTAKFLELLQTHSKLKNKQFVKCEKIQAAMKSNVQKHSPAEKRTDLQPS